MSKNLTRKGLAFGALVALGSSVIAGTPANAAATLTLAPNAGTTYNVLAADTFTLKATGNIDLPDAQLAKLAFEVTNSASATLTYVVSDSDTASKTEVVDGTNGATSTGASDVVTATSWTTTSGKFNTLNIDPTTSSTTPNVTVSVRAFIDVDMSGTVNDGDVVSASQTIKFINGADITPTTTLDDPIQGTAITASMTLSGDINLRQTSNSYYAAALTSNGTAGTAFTASKDDSTSPTKIVLSSTDTAAAGATIGVTPNIVRWDGDSTKSEKTAVYKTTAAAATATGASISLNNTGDIREAIAGDASDGSSSAAYVSKEKVVRSGVKTVSFTTTFLKTNATTNVGAGQPVKIVVAEGADLPSGEEITAGGKTLKNASVGGTAETITYYATTDASGKVAVSVAAKTAAAGTQIAINVYSGNGYGIKSAAYIVWKAAVLDKVVETTKRLGTDTRVITKGQPVAVAYTLQDDFGQPFAAADTTYQVVLTNNGNSTADASFNIPVAMSAGKATATVTDNSTVAGTYNVRATVQSRTTGAWANVTPLTSNGHYVDTAVKVAAALAVPTTITTATAVLADGSTAIATSGVPSAATALVAQDRRFDANQAANYTAQTTTSGVQISGTVTTSTGANAEGVAVVISAPGVLFEKDSASSLGSVTVYTGSNGQYSVAGYAKVGGSTTFTITSAGVSKTQAVTFAGAAESAADKVTITAPTVTLPGRAVNVVVKVVDEFGNAIDSDATGGDVLDISVSGVGYATTIATSTNAAGEVSFKVVLGAGEVGTVNISASFDADGNGTAYTAKTATAKVEVVNTLPTAGATAAIAGSTKRFFVSVDGNSSARNVVVKVAGKTFRTLKGATAKKTYVVAAPKGSHKVTVYVGGKLIATKTISVK